MKEKEASPLRKFNNRSVFHSITIAILLLCISAVQGRAQERVTVNFAKEQQVALENFAQFGILHYSYSGNSTVYRQIPEVSIQLPGKQISDAKISNIYYSSKEIQINTNSRGDAGPEISISKSKAKGEYYSMLTFIPGRLLENGHFRLLDSIEITYTIGDATEIRSDPPPFKSESVFRTGDFYKLGTTTAGVYKITNDNLKSLGIDPSSVQVKNIQLFGTLPGALPELNDDPRTDDLEEVAIYIKGGDDGRWDSGDEIWFYSPGPNAWKQTADSAWYRATNIYDDNKYFFLRVNGDAGSRVGQASSPGSYDVSTDRYLSLVQIEQDRYNILKSEKEIGGGKLWFGDLFYKTFRAKDYTAELGINNLVSGLPVTLFIGFASRSGVSTKLNVNLEGKINTINFSGLSLGGENTAADYRTRTFTVPADGNQLSLSLDYPEAAGMESKGWLDYLTINALRTLEKQKGSQLIFRPEKSLTGNIRYVAAGLTQSSVVWDISDMFKVKQFAFSIDGSKAIFNTDRNITSQLIAFEPQDLLTVTTVGKVDAQNLHAASVPDLLVVYNAAFKEQALDFANYRSQKSGITVLAVDVSQVYNEFSGGAQDPTSIRDLARMFYSRNPGKFKNLLLFGNGSFDYRDIGVKNKDYTFNTNYIPVYEQESTLLHPIGTFPMDDYFCYLDPGEGTAPSSKMDIGVGRFPVNTASEAATIVAKIKTYETSADARGDWRNNLLLIADDYDEGSDDFQDQSESLAGRILSWDPVLNMKKIFADLYKQENLVQGERYPDVVSDINDAINKGVLIANYIGHGGTTKLADEELIDRQSVNSWNNQSKLPLFITGTCSFSVYDDPTVNALGRDCIIRPNGGMVGLITTTRAVYISPNEWIINKLFEYLITKSEGSHRDLGTVLYLTKNAHGLDDSKRFVLLGDPSMQLAFPKDQVNVTSINGKDINSIPDTIGALEKVHLEGNVADANGNLLSSFNGTATITVYDKQVVLLTRGNDGHGTNTPITVRNNIIFHGKASVQSGLWKLDFVVPKDINYQIDSGKISSYAENGVSDAAGYSYDFLVGGESSNPVTDDQAPVITLALDDYSFQSGNTVGTTPLLLAKITDDNGINITGNSIGHDIVSKLEKESVNETILNDYYTADKDNSKAGEVRYQLQSLDPGNYTLELRAWDIANNKSESRIEFIVSDNQEKSIDHVLNYPNPFTTATSFMFEYDSGNQPVEAQIAIFTVSGKLIKTITEQLSPIGKRFKTSVWNGKDDFDGQLAKGVYLYKVKILGSTQPNGKRVISDFQKLVLLK